MFPVKIEFLGELNDLLSRHRRGRAGEIPIFGRRSVKDLIESWGIPHTEVGFIIVNGAAVDFSYIIREGDRILVYPVSHGPPTPGSRSLQPEILGEYRFVCDVHLWKLARRLRILGFDTDFEPGRKDEELADISEREGRVLLTRDRRLLMRKQVGIPGGGMLIRHLEVEAQVREVLARFHLEKECRPFCRCPACNGILKKVTSRDGEFEAIKMQVPPGVLKWCREYNRCPACGKIYWKGSHYEKLKNKIGDYLF